jgi:cyclopropane-fatty-acyl-phospholipid synthase
MSATLTHQTRADRPATERATSASGTTRLDRWIAGGLQRAIAPAGIRLGLWDGYSAATPGATHVGEVIVRDRPTLLRLVANPGLWFGEAYTSGRLAVDGPLPAIMEAISRLPLSAPGWPQRVLAALSLPNTLGASRRNVHHHYDLGNDFYELWLDEQLVYTCAYFPSPGASLENAQQAKLDIVCRKLRLRPGDSVVEAGCGWGALALHMARAYGVRVRAFNVSGEQLEYARRRAAREGLAARVEFVDDDYRNIRGRFDAFVSVGMLEHVGRRHLSALGEVVARTVRRDGGRGLLHFIGRDRPQPLNAWIRRRIFPGAYTPTLGEVTARVLGPAGMSVLDVENLRLHYARTLAHWGQRFSAVRDEVAARSGEEFARAWELYLAGSQAAFATGWMQLFQVVFAPDASPPPFWTRDEIYAGGVPGA